MNLLIISLKIVLILCWVWTFKSIYDLYQKDTGVRLRFDWLSYINISGTIGLTIVSMFAVISEQTYLFTAGLILVSVLMVLFLKDRLVIAGDHHVLIRSKVIRQSEIRKVYAKIMTLYVETKTGTIKVYGPVTDHSVTMRLYNAAGKKRK